MTSLQIDQKDFYFEGTTLVFTAIYLLKRGSCCFCSCRHCPYEKDGQTIKEEYKDLALQILKQK